MIRHTSATIQAQTTGGNRDLRRLPHTFPQQTTDPCDELFRDIAARITRLAQDALAGTVECEQAERQAANGFHCVALLARLQESMELKDRLLIQLKAFLAYQVAKHRRLVAGSVRSP